MILLQLRHPQRLPYISHCYSCNNSLYCWRFFLRVWERISGGGKGQKIWSISSSFSSRLRSSLQNFPSPSNDTTGYKGCINNCPIQDYTLPGDHIPPYPPVTRQLCSNHSLSNSLVDLKCTQLCGTSYYVNFYNQFKTKPCHSATTSERNLRYQTTP